MRKNTRYTDEMMKLCCIDLASEISLYLKEKYRLNFSRPIREDQIRILSYRRIDGRAHDNCIALRRGSGPQVYIHELIHWMSMCMRSDRTTWGFQIGNSSINLNEGLTEYLTLEIYVNMWAEEKISRQFKPLFRRMDDPKYILERLAIGLLFEKIASNNKCSLGKVKIEFLNAMFSGRFEKVLTCVDKAFGKESFRKLFQAEDIVQLFSIINTFPPVTAVIY